ncbi:hypothetical protein NE237_030538 [Protea cynaroides]|uniref:Epidermal patterning factor-like protein n=1 Tax=Protea cynaroides TaxID=273540 RepID=A0A9Q0GT92_9MAGN|nr:hypothetical protein NE237_030538 [Protea cynaroides]
MVSGDGSMAKNVVSSDLLHPISLILVITLHLLLSPASCVDQQLSSLSHQGLLIEDKTRLGSIPPSCHNKCNECHPCTAVQVPTTLPIHDRVQPGQGRTEPMELVSSPSTTPAKYANYKPLGWKCRCGNRLFNP